MISKTTSQIQQVRLIYSGSIIEYVDRFQQQLSKHGSQIIEQLPSIRKFRKKIHYQHLLSWQLQGAIDQIPQRVFVGQKGERNGILFKYTIDDFLNLLNIAVQTPPRFLPSQLCGIPVYYIVADLMNTKLGQVFFSRLDINEYFKDIINQYGEMLKTQKSLKHLNSEEGGWLSQQALKYIDYNDFVCDKNKPHFGFKCWNDWFTRGLVEGARPVDDKDDPFVIVHTSQNYPLGIPATNVKVIDRFWLKQNTYSLYNMFDAEKSGVKQIIDQSFIGGTIYQGFLSPWCYHQWHSPVSGVIQKSYQINGFYYLQNPNMNLNEQHNYINSQIFLSCTSTRHIFIINTQNESIGRIAIIEIGMVEVSSCVPIVKEGDRVTKGQCLGRFEFGGSSHAIIFDRRANLQFNPKIYQKQIRNGKEQSKIQRINSWLAKVKTNQK